MCDEHSSDEFDFDDHEPDYIRKSDLSNNVMSSGQLQDSEKVDREGKVNEPVVSDDLVDRVVRCGEYIQAQRNPYMQQLVQHERLGK